MDPESNICDGCNQKNMIVYRIVTIQNSITLPISVCKYCGRSTYVYEEQIVEVCKASWKRRSLCRSWNCIKSVFDTSFKRRAILAVLFICSISFLVSWIFTILLVPALLLHEYGHLVAMNQIGIKHNGMVMLPFLGMAALPEEHIPTGRKEFYVAFAGPFINLVLVGVLVMMYLYFVPHPGILVFCLILCVVNLFNMLPCVPMDGGRMLRSLVPPWPILTKTMSYIGLFCTMGILIIMKMWLFAFFISLLGFSECGRTEYDKKPMGHIERLVFLLLYISLGACYLVIGSCCFGEDLDVMKRVIFGK